MDAEVGRRAARRAPLALRVLYRLAGSVFGRCEWLDALVFRLLVRLYGTRPPADGDARAIHFFVGSLGLGGAQRQLLELVPFLVRRGYRCKVWVQSKDGCFAADLIEAGASWQCIFDTPDSPWRGPMLLQLWRLCRYRSHVLTAVALAACLRRDRPAVLQCLLDTTNLAGALAGRIARVPVVVTGLRSLHPGERGKEATGFHRRCYRLLRPDLMDAMIANSKRGRASFLERQSEVPASKVRVVWNGLDPAPPCPGLEEDSRGRLGLPPDIPILLWAGRLVPEKRPDIFLRACSLLAGGGRRFLALVVGEGRERATAEATATGMQLGGLVRFLGYRHDLRDLFRVSQVMALTSDLEGFPNTLLEAQLAGCPVVASRAGGTPEVVEDGVTGFLVDAGDYEAMASALGLLLDDPNVAARMGRAGAARSRLLFGAARMGEETLAIYSELAQERGFVLGHDGARLAEVAAHYGTDSASLRSAVRTLLGTDDLRGRDVLDVGAGRGLHACAMAALGARSVTALEPEGAGARSGTATTLLTSTAKLGLPNLRVVPAALEAFSFDPESLDLVLMKAVINHLDKAHVQTLHRSAESRARFVGLLRPLARALRPGGRLVAYDVTRAHALTPLIRAGLLSRDPRFPTIEWEKHQEPQVWGDVLREAGFREVSHRWLCHTRQGWLRELTAHRPWIAFWIAPHFVLTAVR